MNTRDRYEGLQTLCKLIYNEGCHLITLCSIADEYNQSHNKSPVDFIEAVRVCQSKKWVRSDLEMINDGTPLLKYLTGKKWTRKEVVKLPVIHDNDYTEALWYNPATQFHHYRRRYFDTLDFSYTVANGYVEKYYIYTVED